MDDDIKQIDQQPPPGFLSLDVADFDLVTLAGPPDALRNRAELSRALSGREQKEIRQGAHSTQVENHDLFSVLIFKNLGTKGCQSFRFDGIFLSE